MNQHIEQKHKTRCSDCNQSVLSTELQQHKATHFEKCKHCNVDVLKQNMNVHITERHPFQKILGIIRLDITNDGEFNRLLAENRVYAKDGCLFSK